MKKLKYDEEGRSSEGGVPRPLPELCRAIYLITASEVELLQGLLTLTTEWGGYLEFHLLQETNPLIYGLQELHVRRGEFASVNTLCANDKIEFHTHPYYVRKAEFQGKYGKVKAENPFPSGGDIISAMQCNYSTVKQVIFSERLETFPHLVFTPIGNFSIVLLPQFILAYFAAIEREGAERAERYYKRLFSNLQMANWEETNVKLAISRYIENMASVGVKIAYFPPGREIKLEVKLYTRDECFPKPEEYEIREEWTRKRIKGHA
jgi:hypothetical protein